MTAASPKTESPDKREAVLAAALELFAERGFHGTAVPEVAARARVGTGTIYRYFESKEALVNAVFRHWKQALGQALMDDFPLEKPIREQFREVWNRLVRFSLREPQASAFLELHHHMPYLDAESRKVEAELLGPIYAFCQHASEAQVIKPLPPALLVALVYGAAAGLIKAGMQGQLELTPEVIAQAEACAWEAVRR